MELLIILLANIQVLSDLANIANHNRLHAIVVKRGDKSGCLLMFDIFDLVFQFPEVFLFGTNEFLTSSGAFLSPANFLIQMFDEFVTVSLKRSFKLILLARR